MWYSSVYNKNNNGTIESIQINFILKNNELF